MEILNLAWEGKIKKKKENKNKQQMKKYGSWQLKQVDGEKCW